MKNFNNCCLCGNQVWNNYWENFLDNWLHPLWRHDNSFYMFPPARNMKESRHQHDYIRWQAINLDLVVHLLSASHLGKHFFQWLNYWTLCYEFSVEHFGCRVACDGKVIVIVTIVNVPAMMNRASSVSWPEWWVLAGVFRRRNASSLCSPWVAVMVQLMPTSPNYISWGLIQSLLTNGRNGYQVEMWMRNIVINMIKRKKNW